MPENKCGSVSLIILKTELADEEKAHTGENDHDREEISPVEFFADDEWGKNQVCKSAPCIAER